MAPKVILIDRKKYAVGLFWQPVAIGFVSRNYAGQLAKRVDKKLNLFSEYRAMVGLGSRRLGHRVGMPSAAAEVMESFAEFSSFLAVFRVQNFFWMVAVRNGIIVQDSLFDSEDAARDEFIKLSRIPDWGSLFAPVSWELPRLVERKLEDVITGNVKASLKPISRFKADLLSLMLLLLFIFVVAYFYKEPIGQILAPRPKISSIDPILAEEYKKRIDEKNKELDERFDIKRKTDELSVVAPPPETLQMPYENLPDPQIRAQLCYQAIGFLMQPVTGWVQQSAECGETHASVLFRRNFGTLAEFYEIAGGLMPGVFVQEKSESEIFAEARLPELLRSASLEEKDPETIMREVNTMFQKIDSTVNVNAVVDIVGEGVQSVNMNVVEISAASKLTPPEFIKTFEVFSGVYMARCTWDARSRTWNYEVIIYAK